MRGLFSSVLVKLAAAAVLWVGHGCVAASGQATAALQPASAAATAVLPRGLPVRRDPAAGGEPTGFTPSLLALALTGLAGAGAFWWRTSRSRKDSAARRGAGQAAVSRLASQALTQHASVHAIQWNGEEYLVGCTMQQVTLLSRRRIDGLPGDVS